MNPSEPTMKNTATHHEHREEQPVSAGRARWAVA
jgi:hypothetical protein